MLLIEAKILSRSILKALGSELGGLYIAPMIKDWLLSGYDYIGFQTEALLGLPCPIIIPNS